MRKIILMSLLTLVIVSCNKINQTEVISQINYRGSDVIPDNPEIKSKFPLQYSQEFMEKGRTVSFARGKKTLDLGVTEANELFNTSAKPIKGNGGGSTGGTTPTGDITPPRIRIISPSAGYVYNLASYQWIHMNWSCGTDDETNLKRILIKIKGDVIKDTSVNLLQGYGNWNIIQGDYYFRYGDGVYDLTVQAWDAAGNTTISTVLFSRNSQMTPLPTKFPSSNIMSTPFKETQGGEGACAAFAVATAYSIERYYRDNQTSWSYNNMYSVEWIYNIACAGRNSCGGGSGLLSNITTISTRGIPRWSVLPFDWSNGCDTLMFTDAIRADASLNKANYGFEVASADLNLVKMKLSQNHPLVFSFQYDHNYYNAGPGYIWTFPNYRDMYIHAMVLVGYDDSKHAFLAMNSWGPTWGTNGCIWIDYDFFWQDCTGSCWGINF